MEERIFESISALTSNDNHARGIGERFLLENLEANTVQTVQALMNLIANAALPLLARSSAGVLLRRALEAHGTNNKIPDEFIEQLKSACLHIFGQESNNILLKRISHILAQLATIREWPALIPSVIQIYSSSGNANNNAFACACLNLVEIVAQYVPECISGSIVQPLGNFLGQFLSSAVAAVQVATARATAAVIVALEEDSDRQAFKGALGPLVRIVGDALQRGDEGDAVSIIENLVTLIQIHPLVLKGCVDDVVNAMMFIANAASLEVSTRVVALEFIITLTETAPALARRCTTLVQGIIPVCLQFALMVEDQESSWMRGKYNEEPMEGYYAVGEEAIQRISCGMGSRVVGPVLLPLVEQFAHQADWKFRRAAVAAIARFSEGTTQLFVKNHFDISVQFLLRTLGDASQIVRYETVQTLGVFALSYTEKLEILVSKCLPTLINIVVDPASCERLKGHAVSAMINFLDPEQCESSWLEPHLPSILNAIVNVFQNSSPFVLSPCLLLLGSVSKVAGEGFHQYYSSFMPGLKNILATHAQVASRAQAPEQRLVRFKAMECAGVVCDAVGLDVFGPDATELMAFFMQAIESDLDNEFTFDYTLPACTRLAKSVGPAFAQFVPLVMGPLLAGAAVSTQFSMEDADESEEVGEVTFNEETGAESTVIAVGSGSKKRITLNTHALEQKQKAARLLRDLAESLKGHLKTYLVPSLTTLLGMMTDKYSSEVRSCASLALAKVFEGILDAIEQNFLSGDQLPEMMAASLGQILEVLKQETNPTSRSCAAECMRDVLHACYTSGAEATDGFRTNAMCMPGLEISIGIMNELLTLCSESMDRYKSITEAFEKNEGLEEEDKEGIEEQLEEEEDLLRNLVDALGELIKLHRADIIPAFDAKVMNVFARVLQGNVAEDLRGIAVCLLDDIIEYGAQASAKYVPQLLPLFMRQFAVPHTVLRQASVYGAAQCLRLFPHECTPFLPTLVPSLIEVARHTSTDEDEEYEGSTENALFALGFVCCNVAFRSCDWGPVDRKQIVSLWLNGLPLRTDELECKVACALLCDTIERGDTFILGDGYCNLPLILRACAEVLLDVKTQQKSQSRLLSAAQAQQTIEGYHPTTLARLQSIVRQVKASGPEVMQGLTQQQQQVLVEC